MGMVDNIRCKQIQEKSTQSAKSILEIITKHRLSPNFGDALWIKPLANLYKSLANSLNHFSLATCEFDLPFVNAFKTTLENHKNPHISTDLIQSTDTKLKVIIEKATKFQVPLDKSIALNDYPWSPGIKTIINSNKKMPNILRNEIVTEINIIDELIQSIAHTIDDEAVNYQKMISPFWTASINVKYSVETITNFVVKYNPIKAEETKSRIDHEFKSLNGLFNGKAFQDYNDLNKNPRKLFATLLNKLNHMFEHLPEKIYDCTTVDPPMLMQNSLHIFKSNEFEKMQKYCSDEQIFIRRFKDTVMGEAFKRQWIMRLIRFVGYIAQVFDQLNIIIGGFDTKGIQFIRTVLEPIKTNPIVEDFLRKLNEFDVKCSSYNVRIPESIEIKYTEKLLAQNRRQVSELDETKASSLGREIDETGATIQSKVNKIHDIQHELKMGCKNFFTKTKIISILLGNMKYIMEETNLTEHQKIEKITALITEFINPMLASAIEILASKQWENDVLPKLVEVEEMVNGIDAAQKTVEDAIKGVIRA